MWRRRTEKVVAGGTREMCDEERKKRRKKKKCQLDQKIQRKFFTKRYEVERLERRGLKVEVARTMG